MKMCGQLHVLAVLRQEDANIYRLGGCMGAILGLDMLRKKKIFFLIR
jgi:hypothetical protein